MVPIHEKIVAQLEQRRLKKRDLARALGVSPQTATDMANELGADLSKVWALLQHMAANRKDVRRNGAPDPAVATFRRS